MKNYYFLLSNAQLIYDYIICDLSKATKIYINNKDMILLNAHLLNIAVKLKN